MVCSEAGLGRVQEIVVLQMSGELGVYSFLDDFGWEGEQRDGLVILKFSWVLRKASSAEASCHIVTISGGSGWAVVIEELMTLVTLNVEWKQRAVGALE